MFQLKERRFFWFALSSLLGLGLLTGTQPALFSAQPQPAPAALELAVSEFARDFANPVKITHAGDERLFVVEQAGVIHILQPDGSRIDEPFLDISDLVASGGERGLLGLAFEPDSQRTFYVNYTRRSQNSAEHGDTVIARYSAPAETPNQADPASAQIVLVVEQPFSNHNGGDLAFGPDGYLYIPLGDGGSGGDPNGYAQDLGQLLGKMLRIDVVGQQTYAIPPDNPYANDGDEQTRGEIWSSGWRNPWRFSFDRATGDMFIGDVGQGAWEEIDFEPANQGGRNYGWNRCEGNFVYPAQNPPQPCPTDSGWILPIASYGRGDGQSITGGYSYRGSEFPQLVGHYLFADFITGNFWSTVADDQGHWTTTAHGSLGVSNPSSFGENQVGELFVASHSGTIYQVREVSEPQPTATTTLVPTRPPFLTPQSYLPLVNNSD